MEKDTARDARTINNGNSLLAPKTIFYIIVYQNGKQRITHYRVYVFHNAMPIVYYITNYYRPLTTITKFQFLLKQCLEMKKTSL